MKKSWIKKGIVSLIMLAIFMAPISAGIKIDKKNNLAIYIEKKEARAADTVVKPTLKDTSISIEITIAPDELFEEKDYDLFIFLYDNDQIVNETGLPSEDAEISDLKLTTKVKNSQIINESFEDLIPKHKYTILIMITEEGNALWDFILNEPNPIIIPANIYEFIFGNDPSIPFVITQTFTTNSSATTNDGAIEEATDITPSYNLNCGVGVWWLSSDGSLAGCIAVIFYTFWEASAWVARLAGSFLDFFVYYSTNDNSYRNEFITQGWGAIRDISNIFFIIALLYIAIKTVLGLNVTNNKKLIGTVIIIALIINFSLFTTKVVIDGSNILAKIFYNNIKSIDKTGKPVIEEGGEKSVSIQMVNSYNPQTIIKEPSYKKYGPSMFIFTTIILIFITLYTAYIFFSVALLFVARVVSLWMSMIFSPIAFASYTVPFDIPGFGHKEWWKNLLENAMLAPLFIFFLYLIVMFLEKVQDLSYSDSTDPLQKIMHVIIPFAILFILLKKAKDLAVKYSGELGGAITKLGALAGGLALGAATGGVALAGTKLIGARALATANDDNLRAGASGRIDDKTREHFAKKYNITNDDDIKKYSQKKLASANKWAGRSFDLGQTGIGKQFSKMSGMNLSGGRIGEIKTENLKGGRKAYVKRAQEKAQEKLNSYKLTDAEAAKQDELVKIAKNKNNRAQQYKKDREEARNKTEERSKQYEKDKEEARKFTKEKDGTWEEQDFKERYEKGEDLSSYGLYKTIKAGSVESKFNEEEFKKAYEEGDNESLKSSFKIDKGNKFKAGSVEEVDEVKTAKEINDERMKAYTNSLEKNMKSKEVNDAERGAIKAFFQEFVKGAKSVAKNKAVMGLGASGIVTGGAGTIIAGTAVLGGGVLSGLKGFLTSNKRTPKKVFDFMKKVQKSEGEQLIGALRKGENPNKELIKELKKMTEEKHSDSGKIQNIVKKMTGGEEGGGHDKGH